MIVCRWANGLYTVAAKAGISRETPMAALKTVALRLTVDPEKHAHA